VYDELDRSAALLEEGLAPFGRVQRVGALLTLFMTDEPVRNFEEAQRCDADRYGALFRHLLDRGVYLPPSQFEALFPSTAHGPEEIERTVDAVASIGR
jgi:glutamate-1-semialdehyde 2,1-aminomutase